MAKLSNAKLSNSSITVSDGSNTSPIALGGTLTFAGTSNEVDVAESAGTVTIGLPNNVTISGNLTVSGTTTEVSSTTINIADPLLSMATNNNSLWRKIYFNIFFFPCQHRHLQNMCRASRWDSFGVEQKCLISRNIYCSRSAR